MRAREFTRESIMPTMQLTLRNVHQLKYQERRPVKLEQDRMALMQVMCAVEDTRQFDNDKREVELGISPP